jgi:hypothetical protein
VEDTELSAEYHDRGLRGLNPRSDSPPVAVVAPAWQSWRFGCSFYVNFCGLRDGTRGGGHGSGLHAPRPIHHPDTHADRRAGYNDLCRSNLPGSLGRDELASIRRQRSSIAFRRFGLQPAALDETILPEGIRSETVHRLPHQAAEQDWSKSVLSPNEVACPCCVSVPFGP